MKTLLAIINDPKQSKNLIEYAANLSNDMNLNLRLLAVQNPEAYAMARTGTTATMTVQVQKGIEDIAKDSKHELQKTAEEINQKLTKKIDIKVSSEIGVTKFIVEKLVSEDAVQMIIEETKKDTSFWDQKSNTDIIYDVECPVLVVPFGAKHKAFKKIVYATNYKEEDISTLKNVINLTRMYDSEIVALHINETTDFEEKVKVKGFLETIRSNIGYNKIDVKSLVEKENDDIAKLINDYCSDKNADLVVVLKENRNFFERVFKPSSTKKLIKEANLPVLVFHEKE